MYIIYGGATVSVFATFEASLSVSDAIDLEVKPYGDYANVVSDDIGIASTCPLGYTLSVAGPTDTNLYNGGDSSGAKIRSSTGTSSNPVPIIGSNLGTWGYNIAGGSINDNYIGLTNIANTIATKSTASGTGTEATDTVKIYYGVSVTPATEAGAYTLAESSPNAKDDTITYYLTANPNCHTVSIKYDGNGADTSTEMSVTHEDLMLDDRAILYASNYRKTSASGGAASTSIANSYGFAGWSTEQLDPNATDFTAKLTAAINAGKIYGPNETITIDSDFMNLPTTIKNNKLYVTLYAVWLPVAKDSEQNDLTFQTANLLGATLADGTTLNSKPNGYITALKDIRDDNVYTVAKLADGRYWMAENLRLGGPASVALDSTTTDTAGSFTLSASAATNSWCKTDTATCVNQSYLNTDNVTSAVSDMTDGEASIYSYGNYYNYYSATAGSGNYDTAATAAPHSICPKGWHLPTSDTTGDYGALDIKMGGTGTHQSGLAASNRWRSFPVNNVLSGETAYDFTRGSLGYYYPNTTNEYGEIITFMFHTSSVSNYVDFTNVANKTSGYAVRCILDRISYHGNGHTSTFTMGDQPVPDKSDVTLWAANYARSGYGFAGWSREPLDPDAADFQSKLTAAVAAGDVYGPNETVPTADVRNQTLYAIWVPSAGNLQNWTGCSSMTTNQVTALTDTRDGDTYAVAKLADGKCWMIENLRLDDTAILTAENTDNPALPLQNDDGTTSNHLSASNTSWCRGLTAACTDQSKSNSDNTNNTVAQSTSAEQDIYSYGNHYNWYVKLCLL